MTGRLGAVVMSVLLALYLAFSLWYGVTLVRVGSPIAIAIGVALLVFAVAGVWALVAEIRFGVRAERLGRTLDTEGGLPEEELPLRSSGAVDRAAAAQLFERYRLAAEASPEDWRSWYRLALVYDAAGDRRRAREAVRRAIRLERAGV